MECSHGVPAGAGCVKCSNFTHVKRCIHGAILNSPCKKCNPEEIIERAGVPPRIDNGWLAPGWCTTSTSPPLYKRAEVIEVNAQMDEDAYKERLAESDCQNLAQTRLIEKLEHKQKFLEDDVSKWRSLLDEARHEANVLRQSYIIALEERDVSRSECDTWEASYHRMEEQRNEFRSASLDLEKERDQLKKDLEQSVDLYCNSNKHAALRKLLEEHFPYSIDHVDLVRNMLIHKEQQTESLDSANKEVIRISAENSEKTVRIVHLEKQLRRADSRIHQLLDKQAEQKEIANLRFEVEQYSSHINKMKSKISDFLKDLSKT